MKIIKNISNDLFVIEIRTNDFEGYRLATLEEIKSGVILRLFSEENYQDIKS